MTWLLIITVFVLGFAAYLVFAPFCIELNSISNFYGIKFANFALAKLIVSDNSVIMLLKIAGWEKRIDLFNERKSIVKQIEQHPKRKRSKISIRKILNMLSSFKIRQFTLNIDTGSMQLNGILFPLFAWLGSIYGRSISVNFLDENVVLLRVENNIARLMWAYFK